MKRGTSSDDPPSLEAFRPPQLQAYIHRNSTDSKDSLDRPPTPTSSKLTFAFDKKFLDDLRSTVSAMKSSIYSSNEDQVSSISGEPVSSVTPNSVDVFGVRIIPGVVLFENTFENQSYMETISVQNISKNSVTVRIHNPRAWSFRVRPIDRDYLLAPGLKITRNVHYTCNKSGIFHSTLPIYVNGGCYELQLAAYKGQAFVEIVPTSIDFGRVDIGSKPVEKKVVIKNISFCATKFLVDLGSNELDLQVSPLKGWIRPHSSVSIRIQLIALRAGELSSEIWITTDLSQCRVNVQVHACKRSLLALHPNTISDFTLLTFPVTFYGCRRYQTVVVYNMAAASSAFVVLADFGNQNHKPFLEARKGKHRNVKMFNVEPLEGRIRPFEGRIFTVWFEPKPPEDPKVGWKSNQVEEVNDFLCAIRIKRIQVEDYGPEPEEKVKENNLSLQPQVAKRTSLPNMGMLFENCMVPMDLTQLDELADISVLFCLYGEAEKACLTVVPKSLAFADCPVGTRQDKMVKLTNNSRQMLAFHYKKVPFFDVSPNFKKMNPKSTCDVAVMFCARNLGAVQKKLIFEVLALTDCTDEKDFQVVNCVSVKITGMVSSQTVVPQPKFNPGITPMITHEVGFLTDEVTFSSKIEKPKCAMVGVKKQGRPWLQSNATIAFPNDRPLTLRPHDTDFTAKTIFKGMKRYVAPVDESLTYTASKLLQKKAHENQILQYVRGTAAASITKERCCKPQPDTMEPETEKVQHTSSIPREVFVPLTFVQLYQIKVSPPIISFGSVTTSKNCTQDLTIENNNKFRISAKILPITPGVQVPTQENFIIQPQSVTKIELTFHRETLGRYSGTVVCVINGFHSFDIAVVAEVVPKSLFINPDRVDYRLPDIPFAKSFVPLAIENPLNTSVSFSWKILEGSPFKVEPIAGVTPKKGMVWCGVYFEPDSPNYKLHPIKLLVEGLMCHKLKCGVTLPKPNVYFLDNTLQIGYIPLKLTTVKRFVAFNPDFCDYMFVILNKEPIKGITVEPAAGTIKARSCFALSLSISMTTVGPLEFVVYLNVQNSVTVELKVTGELVYPQVEITPHYVSLLRVPCHSVTKTVLMAENQSKARVEVSFDMEEYPQFKVSFSKKYHDPGLSNRGFDLDPGSSQKLYLHFIPKDLASYDFYLPVVINNLIGDRCSRKSDELEAQSKNMKSTLLRNISARSPGKTMPAMNQKEAHMVLIDVVVLKPQLVFSDLDLSFTSTMEIKSFTTTNTFDEPLCLTYRCEDTQAPFTVSLNTTGESMRASMKSTLPPKESATCTVLFNATNPGTYIAEISLLPLQDHSTIYNTVRLTGIISPPCAVYPSVNDIYFTPVSLGIDISYTFHLVVNNSKNEKEVEITYEMSIPHRELFKVEFTRCSVIASGSKTTMPVKITFNSCYPVSIKKEITFHGDSGESTINMFATADNSLLTTHAFLFSYLPYRQCLKEVYVEKTESDILFSTTAAGGTLPPSNHVMYGRNMSGDKLSSSDSSNKSFMSIQTMPSPPMQPGGKLPPSVKANAKTSVSGISVANLNVKASSMVLPITIDPKEDITAAPLPEPIVMGEMADKQMKESIFPMFPMEPAITEFAVHMNRTRNAVQQWVYEQVFNCSYYPILSSYTFSTFTHTPKKSYGRTSTVAMRNVFDVIERICGRNVRRYFTPLDKMPEESMAKVRFTYSVYKQLLDFMVVQGALLCHVDPKNLMEYDEYCMYCKVVPSSSKSCSASIDSDVTDNLNPEVLTKSNFKSLSIQSWVDLFLQIFKTLVLGPAVGMKITGSDQESTYKKLTSSYHEGMVKSTYGRPEEILLSWLTNNYNTQRSVIWPQAPPIQRTVSNFDVDLEDGLVLTAITAAYCPFLITIHFKQMFLQPVTVSEAYHNTVCLITAWDRIKLGFTVTPRDFVRPNPIFMLMLVAHLYKILPSYKPETTIKFMATLNSSETQIIKLENAEQLPITYNIEIFPNSTCFVLDKPTNMFVLKRKEKGEIIVRYTARNAAKANAILLLCGACGPPKFGRNYVFNLEGDPVKLPVTSVFNIISPLNTATTTKIMVDSPHTFDAKQLDSVVYDIWVTDTEPQPRDLNAFCWAKERKRKIPRRLFILSEQLVVEVGKRQRVGQLSLQICCFSQTTYCYWLIFMNSEIGDFIVKLLISPGPPEPSTTLTAIVYDKNRSSYESDKSSSTIYCKTATVEVPCRNLEQWAAIRTMFELTISPTEKEFWGTYIDSNIGFRLLQWMLEEKKERLNEEIELIFRKSKTYKVSCTSPKVMCFDMIHIPNVRARSKVPIVLHFADDTKNHSAVLTLTSSDGQEIRCYNLNVICK